VSLFWRVFAINAAVLVAAVVTLALSPATVSSRIEASEVAVLAVGVALVLAVNLVALRRVFSPLERLAALMRRIDPLAPGQRIEVARQTAEVAELSHAFNDMLDRLERERRDSARRALDAQEEERRRVARELHDEIGQTLTGARGAQARRRGAHQRPDRGAAHDQPADGRAAPREPDGQARHARPRAAHALRHPARAGGAVSVAAP
jgi:two-component system sensor histidine kinase UhpB